MIQQFTDKELTELGFKAEDIGDLEGEGFYHWWKLSIGTLDIAYTVTFTTEGDFLNESCSVGDEEFYNMKKNDFLMLLIILRNG